MATVTTRITQGGRMIIPASVRKAMHLADGEVVLLHLEGNLLRVEPLRDRLAAIQAACAPLLGGGGMVETFLAERRQEAAREG